MKEKIEINISYIFQSWIPLTSNNCFLQHICMSISSDFSETVLTDFVKYESLEGFLLILIMYNKCNYCNSIYECACNKKTPKSNLLKIYSKDFEKYCSL